VAGYRFDAISSKRGVARSEKASPLRSMNRAAHRTDARLDAFLADGTTRSSSTGWFRGALPANYSKTAIS
jgi:hypothetical protein